MLVNCGLPRIVLSRVLRALTAATVAAGVLLGTVGASPAPAPAPAYSPVVPGKAADTVSAYVRALQHKDYAAAFVHW